MTTHKSVPSPSPSPSPAGRTPQSGVVRPPVPLPLGTDHPDGSVGTDHEVRPNTGTDHPHNPGTTWLLTDRCRPAWIAVLDLLDDGHWHDTTDVHDAMWRAANLAPRTIENHLRSAGRRGWITRRNKRIRLRDRDAIEQALGGAR